MEADEPYILAPADWELISAAKLLLTKVREWKQLTSAQLVSVTKLLRVLDRLPSASPDITFAQVSVASPERAFGEIRTFHWWDVTVEGQTVRLRSGGNFYRPSTGSDSFTSMTWEAAPGYEAESADYTRELVTVPDLRTYPDGVAGVALSSGGYSVEVHDDENPLLDDDDSSVTNDEAELQADDQTAKMDHSFVINPADDAEALIASQINADEVRKHEAKFAYGVCSCDFCGCDLNSRSLFVDGRLRGALIWANMCVLCFRVRGEGLGWGQGQLYARQPNGNWRLVAGFNPADTD